MVRIEITRRNDLRLPKGKKRVHPVTVSHEGTEAQAVAHIRESRIAGEKIAPGYMPMLEARLFDFDAFTAWVRNGDVNHPPRPFRTITAAEIEAL